MPVKLILASNSPRRRELLAIGGWEFEVRAAEVDETPLPGEPARDYVLRLAREKAQAALPKAAGASLVVAADTTVVAETSQGEVILGKPANAAEAETMLRQLRGRTHLVYTGLAALRLSDGALLSDSCATEVPMRFYTDEELHAYVASADPLDKAGAYAIQHAGFHPVENLQGCFANVMGLPLCHLARTLARLDMPAAEDMPAACQAALSYSCPVYRRVLSFDL